MPFPPGLPKLMPESVFQTLVSELARLRFAGRISHHFLNEPLIRKDLERLVGIMSIRIPGAYQVLYTNGDFLTEERYVALIEAGIHHIVVTSHSGRRHPERDRQEVHYPEDMKLSNRGGYLKHLPASTAQMRTQPCFLPSEMLVVTARGDVLLCHEDALRRQVMGNIRQEPVDVIWNSVDFVRARECLAAGRRSEASSICGECTNLDCLVPGRAEHMWRPEVWRATETRDASEIGRRE